MLRHRRRVGTHRPVAPLLVLAVVLALVASAVHAHGISGLNREPAATNDSSVADAQTPVCWSCALAHTFTSPAIAFIGVASPTASLVRAGEGPRLLPRHRPRALTARGPPILL